MKLWRCEGVDRIARGLGLTVDRLIEMPSQAVEAALKRKTTAAFLDGDRATLERYWELRTTLEGMVKLGGPPAAP